MCPTSNVHTGAVASIRDHPIDLLRRLRFRVTVNTDNRLMSGVSLSDEIAALAETFGIGLDEMQWLSTNAMKSSFLAFDERLRLINGVIKPGLRAPHGRGPGEVPDDRLARRPGRQAASSSGSSTSSTSATDVAQPGHVNTGSQGEGRERELGDVLAPGTGDGDHADDLRVARRPRGRPCAAPSRTRVPARVAQLVRPPRSRWPSLE